MRSNVIFISGGATGIGRVIARRFLAAGGTVHVADVDPHAVEQFIAEHLATHPQDKDHIALKPANGPADGLFDPSHLNQLLGILLALSAGALIYVGATHLLPQAEREQRRFSLIALFAGILVAVGIVLSKA